MNTELVKQWSMSGAGRDIDGRFRSTDDIRAILGGGSEPAPTPPTAAPVLLKAAEDDDWRPLQLAVGE